MSRKFFFFENRAVYEIIWKNTVQPDRPQMTVWRKRNACCMTKAINTHSTYAILSAFQCNNGCTNASLCYVIRTLSVLFFHIKKLIWASDNASNLYSGGARFESWPEH
jgi:hypothetical protein